ncbi:MAG: hypothetical protein ACOY0T_20845 [Myxococcota bacterium]
MLKRIGLVPGSFAVAWALLNACSADDANLGSNAAGGTNAHADSGNGGASSGGTAGAGGIGGAGSRAEGGAGGSGVEGGVAGDSTASATAGAGGAVAAGGVIGSGGALGGTGGALGGSSGNAAAGAAGEGGEGGQPSACVPDIKPCANGGICNAVDGGYACTCSAEFVGERCQYRKIQVLGALPGFAYGEINDLSSDGASAVGTSWDPGPWVTAYNPMRFEYSTGKLLPVEAPNNLQCSGRFTNADGSWLAGDCGAGGIYQLTSQVFELLPELDSRFHVIGASRDGSTLVGVVREKVGDTKHQAFRWTRAGVQILPCVGICCEQGAAIAASADGSVIALDCGDFEPHRWSEETGMVPLPLEWAWAGNYVNGISGDGHVIVGSADISDWLSPNAPIVPFRWRDGEREALPAGAGPALGCNSDGSIVFFRNAIFRGTKLEMFEDLFGPNPEGIPAGQFSILAMSADGNVIAGGLWRESQAWIARLR